MRRQRDACAFSRIERACLAVVGRWDTKGETRAFHVKRGAEQGWWGGCLDVAVVWSEPGSGCQRLVIGQAPASGGVGRPFR